MNIVYEDKDLLILNKPAGITVNKSDTTTGEQTVQDFVEDYLHLHVPTVFSETPAGEYEAPEVTFQKRAGIVHRLDKETSGVLAVAKTVAAFVELQRQFKERLVQKMYVALVHGELKEKSGEISVPVGRLPWNRKRFGVIAGGREATTHYQVKDAYTLHGETVTLLDLFPKTGRTHQLRVHLKHIGHPIFADFLYAGRKTSRNDRKVLGRVFLHASSLALLHPATGKQEIYTAPLPDELQKVLALCEKSS